MPLDFHMATIGDLGTSAVRLGSVAGWTEAAERGSIGTTSVQVDDATGTLTIPGLIDFQADEFDASPQRLYSAYIADLTVARGQGDSLITGAARRWDCTTLDLNAVLGFRVIHGSDGNRPAE